jgi:hypothetical protein
VPKVTTRVPHGDANDQTERRIASYRPRKIESNSWSAVQPFVLLCVERLPLSGWASTIRVLRALAQLAAWAAGEGLALDPGWSWIPTPSSDLPSWVYPMIAPVPRTGRSFAGSVHF